MRRETIGGENSTDATTTTTTQTTVAPVGEIKPEKDEKSKIVGKPLVSILFYQVVLVINFVFFSFFFNDLNNYWLV